MNPIEAKAMRERKKSFARQIQELANLPPLDFDDLLRMNMNTLERLARGIVEYRNNALQNS